MGGLYKKNAIQEFKFCINLSFGEDTLFFAEVLKRNRRISFIAEPLYCYVLYENSSSHGNLCEKKFSGITSWEKVCELFKNENRKFLDGAKACLAMMSKKLLSEMQAQNYIDSHEFRRLVKILRENMPSVFRSSFSLHVKLALFFCSLMPNLYHRCMGKTV